MELFRKIQELIDRKVIPRPNVNTNPLPEHGVNCIELDSSKDDDTAPRPIRTIEQNPQRELSPHADEEPPIEPPVDSLRVLEAKYDMLHTLVLELAAQVQALTAQVHKLTLALPARENHDAAKRKRDYIQQFVPQRRTPCVRSSGSSSSTVNQPNEWGRPLSTILRMLVSRDLLAPLPPPEDPSSMRNPTQRCDYHQMMGHNTDSCRALCLRIRQLVEAQAIPHLSEMIDYEDELVVATITPSGDNIWKELKTRKSKSTVRTNLASNFWASVHAGNTSASKGVNATRRGTDYHAPSINNRVPPTAAVPPPSFMANRGPVFPTVTVPCPTEALLS